MNAYESYSPRGFYRSADRAVLGGVCAGIADHFGFNLRVLRLLAVIAFFVAMPMAVIAYLAIVFLIPARDGDGYYERPVKKERVRRKDRRRARKQAREEAKVRAQAVPSPAAAVVRDRCQSMDARLAKLEKYITSSRYQLDEEFKNL
jgi:phage shock protein C